MLRSTRAVVLGLATALMLAGCMSPEGDTVGEKRQTVRDMRSETLGELYRLHPEAKTQVSKAVGYGVFSNVGINLILFSAGNGWGVVRDTRSGRDIYMKMISGGIGLGLGIKDFRGVLIFTSEAALDDFVEGGWDASGQADAAAKSGEKGDAFAGAVDVAPGIKLYQLTEHGLALQATIQGTKFWKDDEMG